VGGCGVAGLEAVAILKKMGCDVYATDVRDIEDQIISVGGKFVHYDPEGLKRAKDSGGYAPTFGQEMQNQQDRMYSTWSKKCNVMVLTAAVPGKKSDTTFANEQYHRLLYGEHRAFEKPCV
jgi:NAD(P) transhydrogenase subunit alpha